MTMILRLKRVRESENWSTTDDFLLSDKVRNPEQELRKAVESYLRTEEGLQDAEETMWDFNWGDVINCVSEEILNGYGFTTVYQSMNLNINDFTIVKVTVNQDERLWKKEYESR